MDINEAWNELLAAEQEVASVERLPGYKNSLLASSIRKRLVVLWDVVKKRDAKANENESLRS